MWCDIKDTKYSNRLVAQLGERNAKEFAMGVEQPKFKDWFGNGKVVKTENGAVVPFVNPIMQVINQDGKQMSLLERYRFQGLSDVTRFLSTSYTPGISKTIGESFGYQIAHDDNRFINHKLIEEFNRLYPGLIEKNENSKFSLNEKYQFPLNPAVERSVQLVQEVQNLATQIKGVYKNVFEQNAEQALYEIAQQANSSPSERAGLVQAVGERITEIAQQLFPEASQRTYEQYQKATLGEKFKESWDTLDTLLGKLSNRFNIRAFSFADFGEGSHSNYRGVFIHRYSDGQSEIRINKSKVTGDTPFHEFLHPFISVLRAENPSLYWALAAELNTSQYGLEIQTYTNRLYSETNPDGRLEEAMVQYLGRLSEQKYNESQSLFNRFINWLRSIFKKLNMIDFKNLDLNTTLDDIAKMMVDDLYVADLGALMKKTESMTKYQKTNEDTDLTYAKIYDRIKDRVAILNATIRKRKQGDQFKEDIANLNQVIQNQDEITSINNFVANSLHYVDSAYNRFNTMRTAVKDPSKLTKDDLAYNLYTLGEIQQLLNVFESMSDIQLLLIKEGAGFKDDTMAKLAEAIAKKDIMVSDYKNFALSFLTEWLFPYIEPTNAQLIANGKKNDVITKDQFKDQLIMATRDIDVTGYWLGAVINSQDAISAAVGLALKDVIYDNHLKDMEIQKSLQDAYEKVRSTPLYTTRKGEEEFNMQFLRNAENYEQIGVDSEGEPIYGYVNRLAYHTEYLDDQYEKDRRTFFQNLGAKPSRNDMKKYRAYQKSVSKFYAENTRVNPNANTIIEQKRESLSKRQFERWLLENTIEMDNEFYASGLSRASFFKGKIYSYNQQKDTFRIFAGDLISPSEKYRNPEFNKMMTSEYYKTLYNTYNNANEKLGNYGLRFGIIPQESKGKNAFSDIKWSTSTIKKNLLDTVKAPIRSMYANYDSDRTVQRQDGTEVKYIPVKYTKFLDPDDLKVDLMSSTLKFSQMANNFEGMSEIEPNILVLKTVLNGDYNLGIKGRQIAQTNAKGFAKINAITKKVVPKMAREDMLNARLNEFIDDVMFGDSEFKAEVNILGRDFSINKLAQNFGTFTTVTNMALNFHGGLNNIVVGNYSNALEAMGGRFWGKKDWAWANGKYWAYMPSVINDVAGGGDSVLHTMAEHYDVPQGEFKNEYGHGVTSGVINKGFRRSTLMFMQHAGEHQIQLTGMLSLMHATKLTTKDGKEMTLADAWDIKDADGNHINPLENENLNWTKQDDTAFRNRLHAINKSLHGVYNKFDKSVAQRRWYGKLALMFRKYMFTSFRSRYGRKYVDYELGTTNEGYWNTFFKKLVSDAKDYKFGMVQRLWTKEGYNEDEKNAINRTLFEFGVILAAMMLAGFSNEDDDKNWLTAEAKLQITRMSADITQYINPADFIRVIRNPAASLNLMEKYIAVAQQLAHPTEQYARAAGIAKKGDNKLFIKLLKILPGVHQIINTMTPTEQRKYYNLPGTK
jgi:hypothetical protein